MLDDLWLFGLKLIVNELFVVSVNFENVKGNIDSRVFYIVFNRWYVDVGFKRC